MMEDTPSSYFRRAVRSLEKFLNEIEINKLKQTKK